MSLSITVTAGKRFTSTELVDNAKLNQMAVPTATLSGSADTNQIGNNSVTADKAAFGAWFLCVDSGTASAHALAASGHTISAYATGLLVRYKVNAGPNTGSTTANLASLGAKKIYKLGGIEVQPGDLRASQMVELVYDTALDSAAGGWWLLSPIGNGAWDRFAETEGTDGLAYTATFAPTVSDLTNGTRVVVKWNITNTGAVTFAPDGLTAKAVRKGADAALVAGDIVENQISELVYDTSANDDAGAWLITGPTTSNTRTTVPVRQCVLSCSVASTGLPNYATGVGGTAISFQNCDTTPLVIAFAAGYDNSGAVDYVETVSTNTSSVWTGLSTDGTYYLWVDRNTTTGAVTYGKTATLRRPSYVNGGSAATIDTQHTFLINSMTMWVGNGTTASQVQRVFLGEVEVAANVISSITLYMPRGQFVSGSDETLNSTAGTNQNFSQTHQLGLMPRRVVWVFVCQSADAGYAAGDEVETVNIITSSAYQVAQIGTAASTTALTIRCAFNNYGAPYLMNNGSYSIAAMNTSKWKLRAYAWRGW